MPEKQFPIDVARQLLDYSPLTGEFRLRIARGGRPAGALAGSAHDQGYRTLRLGGKNFLAHRVAWAVHYGEWPVQCIDHINGDRSDNRIANLRDVTLAVNQQNQRRANKANRSGLLGVWTDGSRHRAGIRVGGKTKRLGTFATAEEAHEAYLTAKRQLHAGCTL